MKAFFALFIFGLFFTKAYSQTGPFHTLKETQSALASSSGRLIMIGDIRMDASGYVSANEKKRSMIIDAEGKRIVLEGYYYFNALFNIVCDPTKPWNFSSLEQSGTYSTDVANCVAK